MFRAGTQLAIAPLKGASVAVQTAVDVERLARTALWTTGERLALNSLDDVIDRLLGGETVDRVLERVETAGLLQRVAERMLEDGTVEEVAKQALASPEIERVVASALESTLPEIVVAQLLESQALWVLVDEIARSPSVTEAIAHQGTGFVEQVAGVARDRSRDADQWVERVARRVGRRHHRGATAGELQVPPPASLSGGEER